MKIHSKRIYEAAAVEDGFRVLVDRLWPRGVSSTKAKLDDWPKFLAPSAELRRWYHQDRSRWPDFQLRYLEELEDHQAEILSYLQGKEKVTLVYAAKSTTENHVLVLVDFLSQLVSKNAS